MEAILVSCSTYECYMMNSYRGNTGLDRMTLLTYTGLVLTLATIHEYVPYTLSLILSLILLRLVYSAVHMVATMLVWQVTV